LGKNTNDEEKLANWEKRAMEISLKSNSYKRTSFDISETP
jgi:hypothetical protein